MRTRETPKGEVRRIPFYAVGCIKQAIPYARHTSSSNARDPAQCICLCMKGTGDKWRLGVAWRPAEVEWRRVVLIER